jgi:peptidoglycan/LPS O-acetylase OafA/YrhL
MEKTQNNKIYFSNLDGLRFLAFLSVFISHSALFLGFYSETFFFTKLKQLFLVQGDLGVNFFFVLSGFLITYLLFQEKKKTGGINLPNFHMRRVLRIIPLYFIVVILGFFIFPILASLVGGNFPFATDPSLSKLPWFIFFLSNIYMSFQSAGSPILAVLWAISVEEQFYFLWPLALKTSHRKIAFWIIGIILSSFIFSLFFVNNYDLFHYFTISVMSALGVGALLAYSVEYLPKIKERFVKMSRTKIIILYIFTFALIPFKGALPDIAKGGWYVFLYALIPLLFSFLFALIIAEQNYSENSFWKASRRKLFTSLGKISYGLYAYHLVAFFLVLLLMKIIGISTLYTSIPLYIIVIIATFLLTILLSSLSYRFIEKKFLLLKEKYSHK